MALTALITAADLRQALGRGTYMALFDDTDEGNPTGVVAEVDASPDVLLVLQRAHVMVVSRLPAIYTRIPDGADANISMLLKHAELLYAEAFSYDRHPEYVSRYGLEPVRDGKYKAGNDTMDMIQEAILRIIPADAPPDGEDADIAAPIVVSGPTRDWC
jgi:hypothetical protein